MVPIWNALFDEILGTALLVMLIFAVTDLRNAPPRANLSALIIGFIVVAVGMSFGVDSGYAINPARDFGPRLFAFFAGWGQVALPGNGPGFVDYVWVPIVGPLFGGAVGALFYDFTIKKSLDQRVKPEPGLTDEGRVVRDERAGEGSAAHEAIDQGRTVADEHPVEHYASFAVGTEAAPASDGAADSPTLTSLPFPTAGVRGPTAAAAGHNEIAHRRAPKRGGPYQRRTTRGGLRDRSEPANGREPTATR